MTERGTPVPTSATKSTPLAGARESRPFSSLRRAVDRLVGDFERDFWRPPLPRAFAELDELAATVALPAADVVETDKEYQVILDVPGMGDKDIDVKVTNHTLTIKGEKKQEREEKRGDYYLSERRYGSFRRSFELPQDVDAGAIGATVASGVLTVTLPKTAEAQKAEKRIEIKTG